MKDKSFTEILIEFKRSSTSVLPPELRSPTFLTLSDPRASFTPSNFRTGRAATCSTSLKSAPTSCPLLRTRATPGSTECWWAWWTAFSPTWPSPTRPESSRSTHTTSSKPPDILSFPSKPHASIRPPNPRLFLPLK